MTRRGRGTRFSAHREADGEPSAAAAGETRPRNSFSNTSKQIVAFFYPLILCVWAFVFASLVFYCLDVARFATAEGPKSCELKL